jgi:4-amino-4-deoxy-L-arabinose transferase-like glycosyltransferase
MLFPWLFWLGAWRGLKETVFNPDFGTRFCLATLVPVFIAFSLVSGKQMHYLLPLFPAFALLLARGLQSVSISTSDKLVAAAITLALGALVIYLPFYAQMHHLAPWISNVSMWNGVALIACALLLLTPSAQLAGEVWKMSLFSAAVVVIVVYSIIMHGSGLAYDLRPIAQQLKTLEDAGVPIAHVGKYAGQYQFLGRLRKEPEEVAAGDMGKWFTAHPNGKAVTYFNSDIALDGLHYDYMQLYKGDRVVILGKQAWPPVANHQPISPNNE